MCLFVPVVAARDAFAPSWLKEGAYAKYEPTITGYSGSGVPQLGSVGFFDLSNPNFAGTNHMIGGQPVDAIIETISSSLVWRCVNVNSTMAKLQVTLDYVGTPTGHNLLGSDGRVERSAEVYVDFYTRGVYNVDGVFLGTTHLWLPANPNDGQKIIVWEENSETITTSVTISDGMTYRTVQGRQDVFRLDPPSVTIKNAPKEFVNFYDLDTGLGVGGRLRWDPIFASVGISVGAVGELSETNIDLGPERLDINWMRILYSAILPVAFILLVATLIIKRRKKKIRS